MAGTTEPRPSRSGPPDMQHAARVAPEKAVFRPALPSCSSLPGFTGEHMAKMTFAEQIKHPNWQKKRLEVMADAGFECESCGAKDVTLNVHHKQYIKGRLYWEYERHELACLCEDCHKSEHENQDGLKELLAEVNTSDAFALVAGFHHHSDAVNRWNVYSGREANPLAYSAGFIAWMVYHLDIGDMDRVAEFAASLMKEQAEARLVYGDSGHLFGRD